MHMYTMLGTREAIFGWDVVIDRSNSLISFHSRL